MEEIAISPSASGSSGSMYSNDDHDSDAIISSIAMFSHQSDDDNEANETASQNSSYPHDEHVTVLESDSETEAGTFEIPVIAISDEDASMLQRLPALIVNEVIYRTLRRNMMLTNNFLANRPVVLSSNGRVLRAMELRNRAAQNRDGEADSVCDTESVVPEQSRSVESLQSKEDSRIDICPICYDKWESALCMELECGHIFHRECITSWIFKSCSKYCPMCRQESAKMVDLLVEEVRNGTPIPLALRANAQLRAQIPDDIPDCLPFFGRVVLAGVYVSLLWWHSGNPTVNWLVNNDFCRTVIAAVLIIYVMARSIGLAMRHIPCFVEAIVPTLISFYILYLIFGNLIRLGVHHLGQFFTILTGVATITVMSCAIIFWMLMLRTHGLAVPT